jgi:hypothetical protein
MNGNGQGQELHDLDRYRYRYRYLTVNCPFIHGHVPDLIPD